MTDQELRDSIANLVALQAESTARMDRLNAESTARMDRLNAESTAKMNRLNAESTAKMNQTFAEIRQLSVQSEAKLERMGIHLGGISNNQGDVAEEFFYNSLCDQKDLAGVHYDFVDKHWKNRVGQLTDEFDIVMVNGSDVAVIEVKYKAHDSDLEKLLTQKQPNFRALYPAYKDYHHHFGLASFNVNDELKEKALQHGIIVLQRKGEVLETFVPT